jgi:hypothetical protein
MTRSEFSAHPLARSFRLVLPNGFVFRPCYLYAHWGWEGPLAKLANPRTNERTPCASS